jgi:hypothetical protein
MQPERYYDVGVEPRLAALNRLLPPGLYDLAMRT